MVKSKCAAQRPDRRLEGLPSHAVKFKTRCASGILADSFGLRALARSSPAPHAQVPNDYVRSVTGTVLAQGGRKEFMMTNPRSLLAQVLQHGAATITGPAALISARRTLQVAMDELGVSIVFDPGSAPDLVDVLTVTTAGALEGAAAGAALGLVIGLIAGNPAACTGVGATIGGVAGLARGVTRIDEGWRVRAVRDHLGAPIVTITRGLT